MNSGFEQRFGIAGGGVSDDCGLGTIQRKVAEILEIEGEILSLAQNTVADRHGLARFLTQRLVNAGSRLGQRPGQWSTGALNEGWPIWDAV
ncbi:hypothetical protein AMR42_01380 [Limnothrix sp. PR1529]|nr:hypothetical protein BCR12_00255 [Limnothrix sp. P13C2]PIB15198.1 hypothetical protein AMR42_01380 [Limnothrix sp. PR1529]